MDSQSSGFGDIDNFFFEIFFSIYLLPYICANKNLEKLTKSEFPSIRDIFIWKIFKFFLKSLYWLGYVGIFLNETIKGQDP